ncbi:ABC transporter permease [Bacteroidota bacterium]
MKEYLKIAWRNIWRNKKRTLITTASIFFAMFFALIMRSGQVGTYAHMTKSIVETYSGYIQIHKNGYWKDLTIDNTLELENNLLAKLDTLNNIKAVIPRLESFALASTGNQTKGVMVVGVDPEKEKGLSNPEKNIKKGSYFTNGSDGVLIGSRLAQFLLVDVNDTITLISQGYHGVSAAGNFIVEGIIKIPNPELDRRIIYMNLPGCQTLYSAQNMLTSIVLNLEDPKYLNKSAKTVKANLDNGKYEVMTYKELNPELVQQIEGDQYGGYIMLGLLYMIVGFGVFGTVLMMTVERKREFGVMVAIGMQKNKLGLIVTIEMIMLGFIGILSGILGSLPLILYLNHNPIQFSEEMSVIYEEMGFEAIMPFAIEPGYIIGQTLVVLVIFAIAIFYPIYSISKLKEMNALRA